MRDCLRHRSALALLTIAAPLGAPLGAQRVVPGAFLVLSANDTVTVERVSGSGDSVVSDLRVVRAGARVRMTFAGDANGAPARWTLEAFAPGAPEGSAPVQTLRMRVDGDSLRATGGAAQTSIALAHGTLPWVNPSMAIVEMIARRAGAVGSRLEVPMLDVNGAKPFTVGVAHPTADSVILALPSVAMRLQVDASGRVLSGSVPSQGLRIVRAASLDASVGASPKSDYSAPPGAPYVAEEVRVPTRRGFALGGTFTRPRGAGVPSRVPAVITITGSGPEDRDEAIPSVRGYRPFRDVADTLGRRGIAVLRLDDRGVGASGGAFASATSQDFADDVRAAIAWLRARPDVDPTRIALVGHSEGGLIAPLVASRDSGVAAIVLMAGPAWTGRRILAYQQRYAVDRIASLTPAQRDSLLAQARRELDARIATSPWLAFFADYDPLPTARRVRVPTLVLQGATDRQVTSDQAETLAAAMRRAGNARVTLRVFPTTNHLFLEDPSGDPEGYGALRATRVRPEVLGALADWLVKTLVK